MVDPLKLPFSSSSQTFAYSLDEIPGFLTVFQVFQKYMSQRHSDYPSKDFQALAQKTKLPPKDSENHSLVSKACIQYIQDVLFCHGLPSIKMEPCEGELPSGQTLFAPEIFIKMSLPEDSDQTKQHRKQQKECLRVHWKEIVTANESLFLDLYSKIAQKFWAHLYDEFLIDRDINVWSAPHQMMDRLTGSSLCKKHKDRCGFHSLFFYATQFLHQEQQSSDQLKHLLFVNLKKGLKKEGLLDSDQEVADSQKRGLCLVKSALKSYETPGINHSKDKFYREHFGTSDVDLIEALASEISLELECPLNEIENIGNLVKEKIKIQAEKALADLIKEEEAAKAKPTKAKQGTKKKNLPKQPAKKPSPKKAPTLAKEKIVDPRTPLQKTLDGLSKANLQKRVARWRDPELTPDKVKLFPDLNSDGSLKYQKRTEEELSKQILFHRLFGLEKIIGTEKNHPLRDLYAQKDLYRDSHGVVQQGYRLKAKIEDHGSCFEGRIYVRFTSDKQSIYHLHFVSFSEAPQENVMDQLKRGDEAYDEGFELSEQGFNLVGKVSFEAKEDNSLLLTATTGEKTTLYPIKK